VAYIIGWKHIDKSQEPSYVTSIINSNIELHRIIYQIPLPTLRVLLDIDIGTARNNATFSDAIHQTELALIHLYTTHHSISKQTIAR
jgi:hypothetical protein